MKFFIFDSLSRTKKEFVPIDSNKVRIYACGPTVYDYAHIGNARMAVVTDLLVKTLKKNLKMSLLYLTLPILMIKLLMPPRNLVCQYQN